MKRLISSVIIFAGFICNCIAMDFGLRFNSHDMPLSERTCLTIGDYRFDFSKTFKIGFFFNFYSDTMFGELCSITTDDGNTFSVVASYAGDGSYRLGIAANDKLHLLENLALNTNPNKEDHIDFEIDKKTNRISLSYNDEILMVPFDLSKAKSATFRFGIDRERGRGDVAPIDLRNIRVFIDGKNTHHWDLKYHETAESAIDRFEGLEAMVTNPHWLIDDHSDWKEIYSSQFKENIQTAFNPKDEIFYIVSDDSILRFSPKNGNLEKMPVNGGRRLMVYSNHLMYDTISNRLVNYNLSKRQIAKFDFSSGRWDTNVDGKDEEPRHFNHAYTTEGQHIYTFGGYGFYKYNNDIYKINIDSGSVEDFNPQPELMPLTSASAAIVNGTLYLFGGKGNQSGKQELPSSYTYTMYAYDLDTHKGQALWTLDSVPENFLPTQTMFYNKVEDSFYLGSTANGGELVRISRTKPEWNIASTPIENKLDVHDFVFDLFQSKDGKRLYLVIDKRIDISTHDYSIHTISAPFLNDEQIIKNKTLESGENSDSESESGFNWIYAIIAIALIFITVAICLYLSKRRKNSVSDLELAEDTNISKDNNNPASNPETESQDLNEFQEQQSDLSASTPALEALEASENKPSEEPHDETFLFNIKSKESIVRFDRSKASISLLGSFCIRDKEGNDITSKFTARLKSLLILLLLECDGNETGIKYQTIDEEIWNDKDEKAAQNNRNVSMRKLRILLEEVGDISISYDKGFFKIDTSSVMFDYREIMERIRKIEDGEPVTPEMVDEVLELLLMGPLLPQTRYEWLDKYKAEYSDSALNILNKLLRYELGKDDDTAYRIADSITLHDPLSEEAMVAKCQILSRRKMFGMAKKIYQKFCIEYEHSLGEPYNVSFADACKMKLESIS